MDTLLAQGGQITISQGLNGVVYLMDLRGGFIRMTFEEWESLLSDAIRRNTT